jgi:SPP1 gp7 family putative phage head morphogenesis protein
VTIYGRARELRRELLAGESEAQRRLALAYAQSYDRALREVEDITRQIAAAKRNGESVTKAWLRKADRLQRIKAQLALATEQYASQATGLIEGSQYEAIRKATAHADELIAMGRESIAAPKTFTRAPLEATERIVGFLGDGSPLRDVLLSAAKESASRAADLLVQGVALGKNPRSIGKDLRDQAGVAQARAATIARTETLRAYNTATVDNYRANDDVLEGWQWLATLDARTCALCWAMHGTLHPLAEDFGSHPNCRCTPIPAVIGSPNRVTPGVELFERQEPAIQEQILGPKTYGLYKQGYIGLSDVVNRTVDPVWGPQLKRVPYRDLQPMAQAA